MAGTINYRFLVRGGTAAALAALNEVPLARELILATDTGRFKVGNGVDHYNDLPYLAPSIIPGQIGFGVSSGSSSPIESGIKRVLRIEHQTAIHGWTMAANAVGNATVQLWASSSYPPTSGDSITGSTPPKLLSVASASGTVSGWSAVLPANSWLAFGIEAGATVSRLDLSLLITRMP